MFNRKVIKGQYVIFESSEDTKELEKEVSEDIAKKIIEDAEKKAQEIIEKAREEAENIINEAHLAYAEEVEKGRKDGKQQAEDELNSLIEQYSLQLNNILDTLKKSVDLEIYNSRILLFNILKLLINKFLNVEIFSSPKWIEASLNKILEKFVNLDYIKIHVSSEILHKFPQIIENFRNVDNIEIIEDITLKGLSMVVNTNMGNITIDTEEIIKLINNIIEEELNNEEL
ncbi:hypothetical protein JCM30566_09560 [Marinitoga arctica]